MVNSLISGISISINFEFGDEYEIYTESIKQGFNEPCFFIYNFNSSNNVFLGRRYFGDFQFCINYFPNKGNENSECHEVGERLFKCLEVIEVDGHLQRGWNMKYDILDSVLNFYVNYKTFNTRSQSDTYMEDIKNNITIKR